MDPKDQPQFNPKIPISEVLKQEQAGFVPSAPVVPSTPITPKTTLSDVVNTLTNNYKSPSEATDSSNTGPTNPQAKQTRIIKTYESDIAGVIKAQHESVTKIAVAEEKQRIEKREEKETVEASPKKKFGLLLMAIILIAIGAIAIPTVQYVLNRKKIEVSINTEKTIVPFDRETNIVLNNVTRDEFIETLDTLNANQPTASNIEYRKVLEKIQDANGKTTNQKIAPDIFAGLIGPNMPSALARSFDSDYMYGIEDTNNPKPFFLFKTSSYQQTFANMLRWETKMTSDLNPIMNLGTSMLGHPFADKVIINKDVRAVSATDGTIVFLYGFLDNQTLIITTNPQTFQDINSRYTATRFVQ